MFTVKRTRKCRWFVQTDAGTLRAIRRYCNPIFYMRLRNKKKCYVECGTQITRNSKRHKTKCGKGQVHNEN